MINKGGNTQDDFGVELSPINDQRETVDIERRDIQKFQIFDWAMQGKRGVQVGLPGGGKTHAARAASEFIPTSIFTGQRKNVTQLEYWEDMIDGDRIPVATDLCGVLTGAIDGPTAEAMRDAYFDLEWTAGDIHDHFDHPCECQYMDKVEDIDPDGITPLLGTDAQAQAFPYTKDRVVFMDDPDFSTFYTAFRHPYRKANTFLSACDNIDGDTVSQILRDGTQEEATAFLEDNLESRNHRGSVGDFHGKAPKMAYAILIGEEVNHNLYHADLPGQGSAIYENPSELSQGRESGAIIKLYEPPDLSGANAVIGLDATPCKPEWVDLLGDDVEFQRLFNADDRNEYLHERGYRFRHLNTHAWASQGGDLSLKKCEAYLREVYRKHRKRPHLATSKAIRNGLQDAGLEYLWTGECITYGKHRGTNEIEDSTLLVVLGTPSRNDRWYQFKAGLRGETATPETDESGDRLTGADLDYQSPVANSYLRKIRRGETFQAMLRAGRDHNEETFIYVATGMVPEWLDTTISGKEQSNGHYDTCKNLRSDGEKEVIEALQGERFMSGSELYEKVDLGDEMARKHRQRLQHKELVEKTGSGSGARYSDTGLSRLNPAGDVDLTPVTVKNNSEASPPNSPLNKSTKGTFGGKYTSVISEDDPRSVPKRLQCPDWIRSVQERVRHRRQNEILAERARNADWEPLGNRRTAFRSIQHSERNEQDHVPPGSADPRTDSQTNTTGVFRFCRNGPDDPLSVLDDLRHCKRESKKTNEPTETEDTHEQYDVIRNPDNLSISKRAEIAIEQEKAGNPPPKVTRTSSGEIVPVDGATRQSDDNSKQDESVPDTGDDQESVTDGDVAGTGESSGEVDTTACEERTVPCNNSHCESEYPEESVSEREKLLYELQSAPPKIAEQRIRQWKREQVASSQR